MVSGHESPPFFDVHQRAPDETLVANLVRLRASHADSDRAANVR